MPDPIPDGQRYDDFIQAQAHALRANDEPPINKDAWQKRRSALRAAMFAAMGPVPEKPCDLDAKVLGTLDRGRYRIEKLVFQSRPDVWVTANAYVPAGPKKSPAVLVVHGHWAGARRDPVVQARCLGLVQLGYVVLAVDAFGSGERYTEPARGTYHGALYGATLWPTGQTLLGMQVYDNRRAVDYLLTRPDVDGTKIGITGASGGGNQSMYAGALDERIGAVAPVCSVGNYQSYLKTACCVCEVLPGALRFTEEGDVLGLVAPRALLVINASRDGIQFSPAEAEKSVDRAKRVFNLSGVRDHIKHLVFESAHDYNKPMREAMYGWMNKHLKNVGDGRPVDEPAIKVETAEDLACYPNPADRPDTLLFPPTFAARESKALLDKAEKLVPRHAEEWESSATHLRGELTRLLGEFPKMPRLVAKLGATTRSEGIELTPVRVTGEGDIPLPMLTFTKLGPPQPNAPPCVVLHFEGKREAAKHPVAAALARKGWQVAAPDLRTIGDTKPAGDGAGVRGAPDHNSAEHAVWIGRPLLGQWAFDVLCTIEWLSQQPGINKQRMAVVGIGQAGIVALAAAALFPDRISAVATYGSPVTLVTPRAYPDGTRMGLLAPGLFKIGDVSHLAAMSAPRRLIVANATDLNGKAMIERAAREAMSFPLKVYAAHKAGERITVVSDARPDDVAGRL